MKLSQTLAIEKPTRTSGKSELTELYKTLQKPALFSGHARIFRPIEDGGTTFPPEHVYVQQKVDAILSEISSLTAKSLNITAEKDFANCHAVADVVIDDAVLLHQVPATHLLYLEKFIVDLVTVAKRIPTLDPSESWVFDENAELHKTAAVGTSRTKKVQKPVVLYAATDKHPAQTQLITEDVVIGNWETTKHSGAVPPSTKRNLLSRLEKLQNAVRVAREQANQIDTTVKDVGTKISAYLFG